LPRIEGLTDVALIGEGGSGSVYSAYEPALDRKVALKILRRQDDDDLDRFLREARLMGAVTGHPNISAIFRSGVTQDNRPYLILQYFPDGSLEDLVLANGPLDATQLLRIGVKLCAAVQSLHNVGIVHGDIKPSNVLMNSYHEPVLSDFGGSFLASVAEQTSWAYTPEFVAPDVLKVGRPREPSDVFSLGLTLAFAGGHRSRRTSANGEKETLSDLLVRRHDGEVLAEEINEGIRVILQEALAVSPGDRPTAGELGAALIRLQNTLGEQPTEMVVSQNPSLVPIAADPILDRTPNSKTIVGPIVPPGSQIDSSWSSMSTFDPTRTITVNETRNHRTGSREVPSHVELQPLPPLSSREPATVSPLGPRPTAPGPPEPKKSWIRRLVRRAGPNAKDRTKDPSPGWLASLLADRPSSIDLLDTEPTVEGLARILNDPGTSLPLSVALTGRWGTGKSSAMLQLEERLSGIDPTARHWVPIRFDAWRFQGRESLWIGIAQAIFDQGLKHQGGLLRRSRFRLRFAANRLGRVPVALSVVMLVVATAWVSTIAFTHRSTGTWRGLSGVSAGVAGCVAALKLLEGVADPFGKVLTPFGLFRRLRHRAGPNANAERDIDCLIKSLTSEQNSALIVFLDDLDRCQPSTILESLVCVSEIFGRKSGDPVVFVLGVDMDLVVSVVEHELTDIKVALSAVNPQRVELLGRQFVEKVFQLQVSLESSRRIPVERLIDPSIRNDVDSSRFARILAELREIPTEDASRLTFVRREQGLVSQELDFDDLLALRSAIRTRRSELLSSRVSAVRDAERLVLAVLPLTPRSVKRFDNTFRLQLQIAANTPGSELRFEKTDLTALAKLIALRLHFPAITAAIFSSVGMWEELETSAISNDDESFRRRLAEVCAPEAISPDLMKLIAIGLPEASIRRLPIHSFANVV
jgi:serine/threonine protein kinase